MGILASLVMERRQPGGWKTIGDLFYPWEMRRKSVKQPFKKTPVTSLHYYTIPHNKLIVAHLLGAFETCSVGNSPEPFDDDLRIAGKHRGLPADMDPMVRGEVGDLSHMGGVSRVSSWCSLKEILAFDWTQPIEHRFWVNGPMMLEWLGHDCATLPPRCEDYNVNTDKPQDSSALIVEFDELHELAKKADAEGSNDDRRKKITAWAEHRWAYVEREFPLLVHCDDFLGRVMGQLLDGKDPEDARVICWVS